MPLPYWSAVVLTKHHLDFVQRAKGYACNKMGAHASNKPYMRVRFEYCLVQWCACLITSYHLNLNSSDYRDSCYVTWFGASFCFSHVIDDEHPYTILNVCVCHNGTRVCSSGGCYAKTCPEPFDMANSLYSLWNSNVSGTMV